MTARRSGSRVDLSLVMTLLWATLHARPREHDHVHRRAEWHHAVQPGQPQDHSKRHATRSPVSQDRLETGVHAVARVDDREPARIEDGRQLLSRVPFADMRGVKDRRRRRNAEHE